MKSNEEDALFVAVRALSQIGTNNFFLTIDACRAFANGRLQIINGIIANERIKNEENNKEN